MTPRERAKEIVYALLDTEDHADFLAVVLKHISAAIADEREACAQVAEATAGGHYMARICAAAIRARSEGGQG
jgi:hypothetical protein